MSDHDWLHDWLYVRVYCGGGDDTDALLPELARWLEDVRDRWPVASAHFLRFVDLRGHHLRLRIQAAPDALDEVFAHLDALEQASRRAPVRTLERLVVDPLTSATQGRAGVSCAVYGPEYAKYGGRAGVLAAERHFDVSSRWCLENRVWEVGRPEARVALAARFLAQAAWCLAGSDPGDQPGALPEELLTAHLRRWGPRLPARLRDGDALGALVQQVLRACPGWEAGYPGQEAAGLAQHAARTAVRISAGLPAEPARARVLDLLHMDLNRIGLNPAEECVAGVCARYLVGQEG